MLDHADDVIAESVVSHVESLCNDHRAADPGVRRLCDPECLLTAILSLSATCRQPVMHGYVEGARRICFQPSCAVTMPASHLVIRGICRDMSTCAFISAET
jgi:hypothetical protein